MSREKSKNRKLVYTPEGEIVDSETGEVFGYKTDEGPEWRAFDLQEKMSRSRVGFPQTYAIHDKGLSTVIGRPDYGKRLTPQQKEQIYRLRKWQKRMRVSNATDRSLSYILTEITNTCNQLHLPRNVLETASIISRKAIKKRISRGRSLKSLANASVRVACRQCGVSRKLREIAEVSYSGDGGLDVWRKNIGRSSRIIINELEYIMPIDKPINYVEKISGQLGLSGGTEGIIYKILDGAEEVRLIFGRGPSGLAAAASYIASAIGGERRSQKEIAKIADVTEVTIRNRYKDLNENLMFEISL